MATPPFTYQEPLPLSGDDTEYRLLSKEGVSTTQFEGREVLKVEPSVLSFLAQTAFRDSAFLLRTSHLRQLAAILEDPEASANDRYVALMLLKNAEISSQGILPMCQDTGTAAIFAKKGEQVWTGANDAEDLSRGIYDCFTKENLRYSQVAPLDMWDEANTGTNLPAQIDIQAVPGASYELMFVAKGGGSANKMLFFQETKALLNPKSFAKFVADKLPLLGTSACPPYHLAFVVGGTSAEACMKTLKLASTRYLDTLPATGNATGRPFRDKEWEAKVMEIARQTGIGAQFGGKYFALDARVIRLARHGASCPVGMGVSCSADRNIKARITRDGIFLEKLESNPGQFIPASERALKDTAGVPIDLDRPMEEIRATLSRYPVTTRVSLTGTVVVARDSAHAKLKERVDSGKGLPDYFKRYPVYYAGPAKTPTGYASGSFGPTTAGRMDTYVELFQSLGGSLVMLAKGNRGPEVTASCRKHGGFYLGSVGGPAAILAKEHITKIEVLDYAELGMEAVWKIDVKDFPAFILIDDKGNDFFANGCGACLPPSLQKTVKT
ncbi:MAG TPA: fumarate hydratase [Opitutaceae bacterium]